MNIEQEIRQICADGVRGLQIDIRRSEQLWKKHPRLYVRISAEERKKAQDEMNPLANKEEK